MNKRPIVFKESLRDKYNVNDITAISPECLLRGHDLISLNVIPELQVSPDLEDPEWLTSDNKLIPTIKSCLK